MSRFAFSQQLGRPRAAESWPQASLTGAARAIGPGAYFADPGGTPPHHTLLPIHHHTTPLTHRTTPPRTCHPPTFLSLSQNSPPTSLLPPPFSANLFLDTCPIPLSSVESRSRYFRERGRYSAFRLWCLGRIFRRDTDPIRISRSYDPPTPHDTPSPCWTPPKLTPCHPDLRGRPLV